MSFGRVLTYAIYPLVILLVDFLLVDFLLVDFLLVEKAIEVIAKLIH